LTLTDDPQWRKSNVSNRCFLLRLPSCCHRSDFLLFPILSKIFRGRFRFSHPWKRFRFFVPGCKGKNLFETTKYFFEGPFFTTPAPSQISFLYPQELFPFYWECKCRSVNPFGQIFF